MNAIIEQLRNILPILRPTATLKNETKQTLLKLMKDIQGEENIDQDILQGLIKVLELKSTSSKHKKYIQEETNKVINMIELSINNENKVLPTTKKEDENIHLSKISLGIDSHRHVQYKEITTKGEMNVIDNDVDKIIVIEKEIDATIEHYNGYSKNNPMCGISWSKKDKNWRIQYKHNERSNKDLEKITNDMCKILSPKNCTQILELRGISVLYYKNKKIIIYGDYDIPLFDIRHTINLLDLGDDGSRKKYNSFKNMITHYGFYKNEFSGYILKEYVSEGTMYNIVLSSDSEFSKEFKKDISKLLCELRERKIITFNGVPNYTRKNIQDNNASIMIKDMLDDPTNEQSYDNNSYKNIVSRLVNIGSKIPISKYMEQHVMYLFIITINDPNNNNRIFCKIGYSADIIERFKSLRTEYICDIYLIELKYVKNEQDEKKFHKMMRETKPELCLKMKLNNREKDEVYVFDLRLYNEFHNIIEDIPHKIVEGNIDEDTIFIENMIKHQYIHFIRYLKNMYINKVLSVVSKSDELVSVHQDMINILQYPLEDIYIQNENDKRDHEYRMNVFNKTHDAMMEKERMKHEKEMADSKIMLAQLEIEKLKLEHQKNIK